MNNLSIKQKLNFLLLIPFIGLIIFITSSILTKIEKIDSLDLFISNLEHSKINHNLIFNLSNERALSVKYINNPSDENHDKLLKQQAYVNHIILKMNSTLINTFEYNKELLDIRKMLGGFLTTTDEMIILYTKLIVKSFNTLDELILKSENSDLTRNSESLFYIYEASKFAELEMAHVNSIFLTSKFSANEFTKLQSYHSNFEVNYNQFLHYSNDTLKDFAKKNINSNVNKDLKKYQSLVYNKIYKNELIVKIKDTLGYGGLIDDFRTYLLKGNLVYKEKYIVGYKKLVKLIKEYKSYDTTREELHLLSTIIKVFRKYKFELGRIESYHKEKLVSKVVSLKNLVDVSDFPAKVALIRLSTSIVGVDSTMWYKLSSQKLYNLNIIAIKNLENLSIHSLRLKKDLTIEFILQILAMISLLILAFIGALLIVKDILFKLNVLEKGLISYFDYVLRKKANFDEIKIIGNDEISQMQKVINKNMKESSLFIEEEIKLASKKEILLQNQSKMVQMGEMIANIAHQWRQPLTSISVTASGMLVKKEYGILNDETLDQNCNEIINQTNFLSNTIDTFRNFIKQDKEEHELIIQDEVKSALDIVSTVLDSKYIELIDSTDYNNKFNIINIAGELPQVIINILNNARDVLLEKKIDKPWIKTNCIKIDNKVIITIEDNAGGVPKDILNKIFEPYFTTKHQSIGTGLGLHMSYNIIKDSFKGNLSVTNTKNGAMFSIVIPLD